MNLQVSHEWADRAEKVIPGGSQTLSKGPGAFPSGYPMFLRKGHGSRVQDVDGNLYTDWICGLGAQGLGYSDYRVLEPILRLFMVEAAGSFSLPTTLEVEVAEALVDLIPCAEMVRFTKTGSEACAGAIRIARDYTRRSTVVVCGYHGWHDWYAASMDKHPGVPKEFEWVVRKIRFNHTIDMPLIDETVAAVILEPVLHEAPEMRFLECVAEQCRKVGAVLIFDENVTGFRVDLRGAQHYYGVTPDLAVFGKAMSNGFPLAALVGRQEIMRNAEYISGTFGGETISLAAAKATIKIYETTGCIPRMHLVGMALLEALRTVLSADFGINGLPWKPRITCDNPQRLAGLVAGLARRGHLIHPKGFYISCAHTEADVADFVKAADEAQHDDYSKVEPPKGTAWLRT